MIFRPYKFKVKKDDDDDEDGDTVNPYVEIDGEQVRRQMLYADDEDEIASFLNPKKCG